MDIPGLTDVMNDPEIRDRAEREAERLLDTLKKEVKADTRDIGVLRKELRVTVPGKVIAEHVEHNYSEIMHDALVPGFRKGRAPRQLVEKRFGPEVRESLKTTILGQSFFAATENEKLEVLGDPLFQIATGDGTKLMELGEALPHIKLPDSGDFAYTCELEVKPTFELPELKGIEVKTPNIQITDADVDEHILRQRKNRGRLEAVTDGGAEREDVLVADVVLTSEGAAVKTEENVTLGVRAARLDGVPLTGLEQALQGARPGDQRQADGTFPDDYERPDLRGKPAHFEFRIREVKRLVPLSLDDFAAALGESSPAALRQTVREELEHQTDELVERAKKQQVLEYLVNNTQLDLPASLSSRQTDRAVMRRVIDLQQRGVPWSEIEAHIDELRTSAKADVARNLKQDFILGAIAEKFELNVNDEEVNTEIHRIARLYNRRFDRVRDDLQKQGLLTQLAEQIRQDKCIDLLLAEAKFVEVQREEPEKQEKKQKKSK
jgi:trigger factor